MLVSIVIPCYYCEKTIRKEVEMILEEFERHDGYECELVLANDGSVDGSFNEITALAKEHPNVHGLDLMRNFGQHNALMAALNYAQGELIMGMDDDMQTHPSQMFKLIDKIQEGYDLVYGIYPEVKNSPLKRLTSKLNKESSRIMLNRPKEVTSSNFWIITKTVRDEVIKHTAFNPYVDAIFYRVTHNIGMVQVEHFKRDYGSSGYTFRRLMRLWVSYWNFSVVPLRISFILGLVASIGGLVLTILIIINKILNPDMIVGWTSTMCVMILLFGAVLMVLGIVGEYLGKIILILNDTPQFIVRDTVNIDKEKDI
ncbi:MAG: glycosyltransferase family 2 protein [Firmicutes bacterium]|nr:glycosyltransferase family 2 protein [Bacillota bacterium]